MNPQSDTINNNKLSAGDNQNNFRPAPNIWLVNDMNMHNIIKIGIIYIVRYLQWKTYVFTIDYYMPDPQNQQC